MPWYLLIRNDFLIFIDESDILIIPSQQNIKKSFLINKYLLKKQCPDIHWWKWYVNHSSSIKYQKIISYY